MQVRVLCFASAREALGSDQLELELPDGATVGDALEALSGRAPSLLELPLAFAVNQDYGDRATVLGDGDELALIPPISGGDVGPAEDADAPPDFGWALQHDPLDPRDLEHAVRTDADGAVITFHGVTRNHNEGDAVLSLRYEAYAPMVGKVLERLFEEAKERFDITRARIAHRLGEVPVGEASVLVVVSSAHRGPSFEGARYLMDELKKQAPIFKQELLDDGAGGSRWVGDLPDVS